MSNILVLGASGRVGRFLRRKWESDGTSARVAGWIARSGEGHLPWSPEMTTDALPRADSVIALWGVTSGSEEALAENAALARRAIELARDVGARRVIHMSSAAVYGGGAAVFAESDACDPRNPYGRSKLAMERAIAACPAPPVSCILRLANVAGADALVAALDRGDRVTLDQFEDGGGPARSYVAPSDLADLLGSLCSRPPESLPAILNVAGPAPVAMADVVCHAGRPLAWREAPKGALQRMSLSDDRLARQFRPLTASADAARLVADWRALTRAAA